MNRPSTRFVCAEVFHAIVDETDLGPGPVIDDESLAMFDTIEHMLEGGPFAEEVQPRTLKDGASSDHARTRAIYAAMRARC